MSYIRTENRLAIIYSSIACEEDLVHSASTADDDAMDNMKRIYKSAQIFRRSITDFTRDRTTGPIPVPSSDHDVPAELCLEQWMSWKLKQELLPLTGQ